MVVRRHAIRLAFCALAAACSTMPRGDYPPHVEQPFRATFTVEHGRLDFPSTTRALIVRELTFEPPPLEERFDADGSRWFAFASGTVVTARGLLRIYADANGRLPTLRELLPEAHAGDVDERP